MAKPFTKTQLIIALIVFIFLSSIPSIIYIINFRLHNASSDPANWGTFGDFIGGTTNVILSIINIIITAYIAYLIKTLDDKRFEEQKTLETQRFEEQKQLDELRHKQNLDLQNDIFIRSMREEVFKDFNRLLQELHLVYIIDGDLREKLISIKNVKQSYLHLKLNNLHLFTTFSNQPLTEDLDNSLEKIIDFIEKYISKIKEGYTNPEKINQEKYGELFVDYVNKVTLIKRSLTKEILTNGKINNYIPTKTTKTSE